jgi:hypothetical protein
MKIGALTPPGTSPSRPRKEPPNFDGSPLAPLRSWGLPRRGGVLPSRVSTRSVPFPIQQADDVSNR